MSSALSFPSTFIWGTATSAYQIEGAATTDGKGPSIWDVFCRQAGAIEGGASGAVACDHYHRLDEDLGIIAGAAPNYRFSLSWPRLLPDGAGAVNAKGIAFYDRLIDGLLARGVTPWVTLYHWDLPQALQDRGGWTNRDIVGWFGDYAETCHRAFGDRVGNWMIVNEPSVVSVLGHALGSFAPGIRDPDAYAASVHHLNMVVGETFRRLKALAPRAQVGSTCTPTPCRMEGATPAETALMEATWVWNYIDPALRGAYPEATSDMIAPHMRAGDEALMRAPLDFLGIQHYSPIYFKRAPGTILGFDFGETPSGHPVTQMGWPVMPEAFNEILLRLHARYGTQRWLVTENGMALDDALNDGVVDDRRRINFLRDYIGAMNAARGEGMRIDGYFAWSLMDNFEWASGYRPRFGLVHVDYADNLRRTPKESYHWYSALAHGHPAPG